MKERDFTRQVQGIARALGWLSGHFGSTVRIVRSGDDYKTIADRDAAGFPDLVLVRRDRLIFAELKVGSNKPTPIQQVWLQSLRPVAEVYVWSPKNWAQIEDTLR